MFEQTFIQSRDYKRNPWSIAASLSLQCLAVTILLILPLLHTEVLRMPEPPAPHLIRTWINQPPPPPRTAPNANAPSAPTTYLRPVFVAPSFQNNTARQIDMPSTDTDSAGWIGQSISSLAGPMPFGGSTTLPPGNAVPPASTTPVVKQTQTGPLKVGGGVEAARLVFGPRPAYPALARVARSEGVVKLEAIIAADGSIRNLRVVAGPPLLVEAALSAVRQWRYQPTLLNGVAVEVVTEIEVNFSLTR